MASIWDADDETESVESLTGRVDIMTLGDIAAFDLVLNKDDEIRRSIEELRVWLDCLAQVFIAAYKVAGNISNLKNYKSQQLLEQQVIRILVKIIDDDVTARSLVMESFSSVHELSISIKRGAELATMSNGSAPFIAAA